eukprot:58497_1
MPTTTSIHKTIKYVTFKNIMKWWFNKFIFIDNIIQLLYNYYATFDGILCFYQCGDDADRFFDAIEYGHWTWIIYSNGNIYKCDNIRVYQPGFIYATRDVGMFNHRMSAAVSKNKEFSLQTSMHVMEQKYIKPKYLDKKHKLTCHQIKKLEKYLMELQVSGFIRETLCNRNHYNESQECFVFRHNGKKK